MNATTGYVTQRQAETQENTKHHNPTASTEFLEEGYARLEEDCREFLNMREALLDVAISLERDSKLPAASKLKKRILNSRTKDELSIIRDCLITLSNFYGEN